MQPLYIFFRLFKSVKTFRQTCIPWQLMNHFSTWLLFIQSIQSLKVYVYAESSVGSSVGSSSDSSAGSSADSSAGSSADSSAGPQRIPLQGPQRIPQRGWHREEWQLRLVYPGPENRSDTYIYAWHMVYSNNCGWEKTFIHEPDHE